MPSFSPDDPLTQKQKKLVAEFMKDGHMASAFVRAGYSPKFAVQNARKEFKKPHVKAAVQRELEKFQGKAILTAEQTMMGISAIAISRDVSTDQRLRAYGLLMRYHKLFIDRVEVGKPGEFGETTDASLNREIDELVGLRATAETTIM